LYISVVLAPRLARTEPQRATAILTLMAGVAIAEGVHRAIGVLPDIKWPNDLLIGTRKLAGILAEGVHGGDAPAVHSVVLGYGVNVLTASFPPELADRVTSLESEIGRPIDRALVCASTLSALAARYDDLLASRYDAILDAWRRRAPRALGASVTWDTVEGLRRGITAGIDQDGALLVSTEAGVARIMSGEVRWE
jgi:BirA family biotin operon repressor/biotin-[acetyl-CoA-carboxylase] ligase